MKILVNPGVSPAADSPPPAAPAAASSSVSAPPSPAAPAPQKSDDPQAGGAAASETQVAFTVQQDASGRIFYLITDAKTGQEIGQLPPEELRNVGEGIAEYVKQREAQSAANQHIETKA
jgi:hypothetical protein